MVLTAAPGLIYVIGVPAAVMVCAGVIGTAIFMFLGRIHRS
jgi:hypothetical protein